MRTSSLTSVVLALMLAVTILFGARVADSEPAQTAFSWSGWYFGGSLGWGWRSVNQYPPQSYYNNLGVIFGGYYGGAGYSVPPHSPHNGIIAGVTAGYNYQYQSIVLGGEYDILYARIAKSPQYATATFSLAGSPFATYTAGNYDPTDGDSNRWYGIARARIGVAMDRWLPYVTGGAAYRFSYANSSPYVVAPSGAVTTYSGYNHTNAWGWVLGGGIEYAWADNLFVKVEYLHLGFGNATYIDPIATTAVGAPVVYNYKRDVDVVRVGINFPFTWGGRPSY